MNADFKSGRWAGRLRSSSIRYLMALAGVFCAGSISRSLWMEYVHGSQLPRMCCDVPHHDFGAVDVGSIVQHRFRIRNTGGADLTIHGVTTSCGCVSAVVGEVVVPPHYAVEIPVEVTLEQVQNQLSQTLTVRSDDPVNPDLVLKLSGKVVAAKR